MTNHGWVSWLLAGLVALAAFWPGAEPPRALDKPKKGYWTVATLFWPLRRAYHDLGPHHVALQKGQRSAWLTAAQIAILVLLAIDLFHLDKVISPDWIMVEIGAVAFFLGRASGFWSADRRIIKASEIEGPGETKTNA